MVRRGSYGDWRCRRQQPAAANISSTSVAGSGTPAFAMAPEPLPAVWPKWDRHKLWFLRRICGWMIACTRGPGGGTIGPSSRPQTPTPFPLLCVPGGARVAELSEVHPGRLPQKMGLLTTCLSWSNPGCN
jgi:hypothetical protein